MPIGEAGEIHIGGMGVSRGYRHRPALTGAAFMPDPLTNQPGARLYKSGDLGRFLRDGIIEFLGRIEHQVKIRGYRIELGEIEAALAGHPGVAQAAAMTVNTQNDKRLVGYVVAKPGYGPDPQDLQHYLRQKLPEYMVPSRFMVLERMPLTSSMQYTPQGQLNHTRMTLLAAERPHSEALISHEAFARITNEPRLLQRLQEMSAAWAEYDREILRLWAEDAQLGWSRFSSRPIEVRHVPGNHMDMIHEPHVRVLATALRETIQADDARSARPRPEPVTAAHYPLSKVQEGLWLLQKFSPEMSAYNVPVAIRFKQDFDVDIFRHTCAYLLDQHPILGSLCVEVNGEPRQYIPAQRPFAFEHEVIDHLDERDIVPFLSAKVKQPFDLERGPLMRVHLFSRQREAERDHIGLITIHHIVFDGTSSVLLARALVSTYHALSQGKDATVALLLTTESLASQAQAFKNRVSTLELIYLDKDWSAIDHCHAFYKPPTLQPENLAYVIYTSGSTGRPKGVMIPHLTTTRHCHAIRDYFRMAPGERVCLQSPISFDASIEQIFAPLSIGPPSPFGTWRSCHPNPSAPCWRI